MVSPETMNSSISTIHGPTETRPAAVSRSSAARGFGTDLEVVVEHHGLPVEQEARVRRVGLEHRQQRVEQLDETHAERLERRVPLAIPVRVRHDRDA